MADDLYHLAAFSPEHGIHDITLSVRRVRDEYAITCKLPITVELLTGYAYDCFAALQIIRRKAEGRNWHICCQGARRNVRPSAMSRQMGGGVMAYVLETGQPGRMDSMVNIFDEDSPEAYASVADQEAYAHAWFQSLGRRPDDIER